MFARFPHISESIFSQLDYQSLLSCRQVSKSWYKAIAVEKASYLKIIKNYTKCTGELLEEILEIVNAPIILVSILNKIFDNFPRGTNQSHQYLKMWGNTPIHIAAGRGHLAAYNLIMENVVDKNPIGKHLKSLKNLCVNKPNELKCASNSTEYTPLHLAARNGHFSTVKLILENVGEKNPPNNNMCTPLHLAAANGNHAIFQMIFECIGNKNPIDVLGYTPLHIAAAHGHFSICLLVLSYNENVKNLVKTHLIAETPYHLAAANGHINVYKLLIDRNILGQNIKNSRGRFPLHHAAKYGHLNICKLILENEHEDNLGSANCNVEDKFGISPFDLAIRKNQNEIQKYFTDKTAFKRRPARE